VKLVRFQRSRGESSLSISDRLGIGFALIGLFGTLTLCLALFIEYRIKITDLAGPDATRSAWREMIEHVGLPILVLIVPTLLATRWVIERAFAPLEQAAQAIEAAPAGRGVRIDTAAMPVEAMPFVSAINRLLERLDGVAEEQEAFASDVAHELRTPLAILSLGLDGIAVPDAARLKDDVGAMRRLIDQLLLLAQVNAEAAVPMPSTSFTLAGVAEDVVARLAPRVIADGREIELDVHDADVAVTGHREAVSAALRNLVENAVRATPPGGRVVVSVGEGARLCIADEGPGLDREQLARLVRRHVRAEHASIDGAGLGLAIADRIMAAHGGRVETDPSARSLMLVFQP
jgi:signal transduction histidine kinase